ncbi:MAG: ParA family partition ATPase [Gammaproteobacteria bacterium]
MPVIAVVGNKGGAGKTTLSVNLAAGLARQAGIVVVDADPQGSSLQWRELADEQDSISAIAATDNLQAQITELAREFDYVVVDCPPSVHASQTISVLEVGDLALIPVQPSPVDLWATVHIERAIANARRTNPSLRSLLVINQLEIRTTLSRVVREALTEISLPVARTALRRRAVYRNSALEGKSVFDMGARGAAAAEELEQLIQEVTA